MRATAILLAGLTLLPACRAQEESAPARVIRFAAADGAELEGDLRGSGARGVLLAHEFPRDRAAWAGFASLLANRDYLTLAFDFRGYGGSAGPKDIAKIPRDVLAAVEAIREEGATSVVVIGASMGGTAALVAASTAGLDGVVTLSAPAAFEGLAAGPDVLAAVDEPKLFLAAEGDGTAGADAQAFYVQGSGGKRVEIVTGEEHGTEMLKGGQAEVVRNFILTFLDTNA